MSPTSYQAAPPRITFEAEKVPHAGRSVKYHRRRVMDGAADRPPCAAYPLMKTWGGTGSR